MPSWKKHWKKTDSRKATRVQRIQAIHQFSEYNATSQECRFLRTFTDHVLRHLADLMSHWPRAILRLFSCCRLMRGVQDVAVHFGTIRDLDAAPPSSASQFIFAGVVADTRVGVLEIRNPNLIERLDLTRTGINLTTRGIISCPNLQELSLAGCMQLNSRRRQFFVDGLSELNQLPFLRKLDLSDNTMSEDLLLQIPGQIDTLRLSNCLLGGRILRGLNLRGLEHCVCLRWLDLSSSSWLESADGLAGCTSLETLDLSNCQNLHNLFSLSGCVSLRELDLSGCARLENVRALGDLKQLQKLSLQGCSNLKSISALGGSSGLRELRLSLPGGAVVGGDFSFELLNISMLEHVEHIMFRWACPDLHQHLTEILHRITTEYSEAGMKKLQKEHARLTESFHRSISSYLHAQLDESHVVSALPVLPWQGNTILSFSFDRIPDRPREVSGQSNRNKRSAKRLGKPNKKLVPCQCGGRRAENMPQCAVCWRVKLDAHATRKQCEQPLVACDCGGKRVADYPQCASCWRKPRHSRTA